METKKGKEIKVIKKDKEFVDLYWLVKIADITDVTWRGQVQITKNKMIVTDGRRLHLLKRKLKIPSLQKGQYKVKRVTKDEIILESFKDKAHYPDYEKIMPNTKKCTKVILTGGINEQMCQVIQNLKDNYINVTYLRDVLSTEIGTHFDVYISQKDIPVLFRGSDREAMIMPIRIT